MIEKLLISPKHESTANGLHTHSFIDPFERMVIEKLNELIDIVNRLEDNDTST